MRIAANGLGRLFAARLLVLAGVVLAATTFTSFGSAAAVAAVPGSTYDTAAYVYDAPALLSSPSAAATYVRGSPSGPEVVSRVRSVSARGRGVAANTVGRAADDTIDLYRAVGVREYESVM